MGEMRYRTRLPKLTERLTLGRTLQVSPFCLGIVEDPRTIPAAFDAGINFFFVTADMHWPRYEKTRRGLADLLARGGGVRDEIVVGVVSYVTQPEFCHMPFVELLAALPGLRRIDLTIIGGSYRRDFSERAVQYERHRAALATRALGTSFHDRRMAADALNDRAVDVAFVRYNPMHRGAEKDVFAKLPRRRRSLLYTFTSTYGWLRKEAYAKMGLSTRHWRPEVTDYYRFALAQPAVDGLLCALPRPKAVEALARAVERGPLTEEERTYIADLADLTSGEARLA
jgi:hypothetical protein